jgi:hypothetical protein
MEHSFSYGVSSFEMVLNLNEVVLLYDFGKLYKCGFAPLQWYTFMRWFFFIVMVHLFFLVSLRAYGTLRFVGFSSLLWYTHPFWFNW